MSATASSRITPETYDFTDISFETGVREAPDGSDKNPFAKLKVTSGKKEVNFKVFFKRVYVSNYWQGTYDKYANRSCLLIWKDVPKGDDGYNPTTKSIVAFFDKFTADLQGAIEEKSLCKHMKIPKDYKIPNPLRYDEAKKEYQLYATVSIENIPGEDYGAFEVKLASGKNVPITKMKKYGFLGNVSGMSFEIKGKAGKVHVAVKLYEAIAAEFIENQYDSSADARNDLANEFGMDAVARAEKILEESDDEAPPSSKGGVSSKINIGEDSSDEEEEKPKVEPAKAKSTKVVEPPAPVEVEKKKKPKKEKTFKASDALAD